MKSENADVQEGDAESKEIGDDSEKDITTENPPEEKSAADEDDGDASDYEDVEEYYVKYKN